MADLDVTYELLVALAKLPPGCRETWVDVMLLETPRVELARTDRCTVQAIHARVQEGNRRLAAILFPELGEQAA